MLSIFQESIDYKMQRASSLQQELRVRKAMKCAVDIRELKKQAKVTDDLKYV
jgi:hypothetical protein